MKKKQRNTLIIFSLIGIVGVVGWLYIKKKGIKLNIPIKLRGKKNK